MAGKGLRSFYEKVGMAAWLMTKAQSYAEYPTACLAAWIEPAILHNQIHFFMGDDGKPVGYFTWAYLAADTEHRLIADPDVLFHISEWNEGDRLWVMDMVLIDCNIQSCIREIRSMFPQVRVAKSLRRNGDGQVRKVVTWKRLSSARV